MPKQFRAIMSIASTFEMEEGLTAQEYIDSVRDDPGLFIDLEDASWDHKFEVIHEDGTVEEVKDAQN